MFELYSHKSQFELHCSKQALMFPSFLMASLHHRLKESSKNGFFGPSDSISFFKSELKSVLRMREKMEVDPDTLVDYLSNETKHKPLELSPRL